ncbi:MAG: cob(I)yrinic acid a,c-diamide adenosyltransferase [Planctomycetes bacterium]|nr:cob(I)yrinic acid a,c-diamide adenosyltransferase [Planctomycetota bacterium]
MTRHRIYTRKGDEGYTRLASGDAVKKCDLRVEAYGNVDELMSVLGLLSLAEPSEELAELVSNLQTDLFDLSSELASVASDKEKWLIEDEMSTNLEKLLDHYDDQLEPLRNFIVPGGTKTSAVLHLARTVCRRAERSLVELAGKEEDVNPSSIMYLNRLSDLLFTLARYENNQGKDDVILKARKKRGA